MFLQLLFIDFQTLSVGHPAKDFWYYIYCTTDSNWRKSHLEECLDTYFSTFQNYLKQAKIDVTYEDFKTEMFKHQAWGLVIGSNAITIMMNPNEIDLMKSFKEVTRFFKWRLEQFSRPQNSNDHEMLHEINRRIIDVVEESYELGLLD